MSTEYHFVQTPSEDHFCPVCTDPLTVRRKCDHVLVKCSFGCGQQVRSGEMKKHKTNSCVKRPTTCEYCGFHDKRDYVHAKHYPICLQFPVDCPNKCQVKDLKRGQLQVHKNECPLQKIVCPFSTIGCTIQLPRKEMPLHMKEGVEQHLLLMLQKMGPPPEPSQPTLPQLSDNHIPQDLVKVPPVEFTMMDFLHKKTANTDWDSPPFYTHPQGYKMCLNLEPNGCGTGKGTHCMLPCVLTVCCPHEGRTCTVYSLYAALMKGEHDDSLQWPFEGNIVVELLNWREDQQHVVQNFAFSRENKINCIRVHRIDTNIGDWFGNHQFISHSSLSYNSGHHQH